MSRKHYQSFAAMFAGEMALAKHSGDKNRIIQVENIIRSAADIFAQDNPNFDRARFYAACGLSD